MEGANARDLIDELEKVRSETRRDRRLTSIPLLTFGTLTLVQALTLEGQPYQGFYWVVAGPVGFGFVAWWYRRHEQSVGVGSPWSPYAVALVAGLLLFPILMFGAPLGVIALGLLVIAMSQRNVYLIVWAMVYGIVGVLEHFYFFTNRASELASFLGHSSGPGGYFRWAPSPIEGVLGLMLIAAGLVALRRESARRRPAQ